LACVHNSTAQLNEARQQLTEIEAELKDAVINYDSRAHQHLVACLNSKNTCLESLVDGFKEIFGLSKDEDDSEVERAEKIGQ
jgi:hypothetical protein